MMRAALIFIVLVAIALFLSARPYPLDYSASGMEQRITALEARVDSLEGKPKTERCETCGKYILH